MKEKLEDLTEKELKKAKKKAKKKRKKEKVGKVEEKGLRVEEKGEGGKERGNEGVGEPGNRELGESGAAAVVEQSGNDEPRTTDHQPSDHRLSTTDHKQLDPRPPTTSPQPSASQPSAFSPLQDAFIQAWQEAGQTWGLPPAMGAVHAVLLSRDRAWSTDEVMEALAISRGNAHMQLKALVEWGVVHAVRQLGSRRIGYVAERDVWRIATAVAKQRRKRELQPILEMGKLLRAHGAASRSMDDRALKGTMREIVAFGRLMDKLLMETLKRDERWWERLVRRWINRS